MWAETATCANRVSAGVVTEKPRGLTARTTVWSVRSFPLARCRLPGHHGRNSEGVTPYLRARVRAQHQEVVAQDQAQGNIDVK